MTIPRASSRGNNPSGGSSGSIGLSVSMLTTGHDTLATRPYAKASPGCSASRLRESALSRPRWCLGASADQPISRRDKTVTPYAGISITHAVGCECRVRPFAPSRMADRSAAASPPVSRGVWWRGGGQRLVRRLIGDPGVRTPGSLLPARAARRDPRRSISPGRPVRPPPRPDSDDSRHGAGRHPLFAAQDP